MLQSLTFRPELFLTATFTPLSSGRGIWIGSTAEHTGQRSNIFSRNFTEGLKIVWLHIVEILEADVILSKVRLNVFLLKKLEFTFLTVQGLLYPRIFSD